MTQDLIVALLFVAALGYVAVLVYRTFFRSNTSCSKGCGGACGVDFKKIEEELARKPR